MWLLDLSAGVTENLLLAVLLSIEKNNFIFLKEQLVLLKFDKDVIRIFEDNNILISDKIQQICYILNNKRKISCKMDKSGIFTKKVAIPWEQGLEPFKLFVYLSILILFEKYDNDQSLLFTIPSVGINTSAESMKLFKGRKMRISQRGESVSFFLASVLVKYCSEFIDTLPMFLEDVKVIEDFFDNFRKIKVLKCKNGFDDIEKDSVSVIEANIDDMTSEILASVMEKVMDDGALDFTIIPVTMKKNRAAFQIQVLCNKEDSAKMCDILLTWTSTFGVRRYIADRVKLKREIKTIMTVWGPVRIKLGYRNDKIIKISPEFEDIRKISKDTGKSTQLVYNTINKEIKNNISM